MSQHTDAQYWDVVKTCQQIFEKKTNDYGTSWRVMRPISLADQIYIKAMRIRQLQDGKQNMVGEDANGEWRAIINYGVIACMQLQKNEYNQDWDLPLAEAQMQYQKHIAFIHQLMQAKNNDYGEAWRNMSAYSFVDLIITKILRIKQIIANDGATQISEGMDANFHDIVNYAVFALILDGENTK
jgi:Nucleotide modification associated domain 1